MIDFKTEYFTMKEEEVIQYVKMELDFFKEDAKLVCKEIGDGNLNYVFLVKDEVHGDSIIIKQAGPVARISDEFVLSPDRNRIESEILQLHDELAEGFVPKVYHYDPIMNCTAMEDLSDHTIMREALLNKETFPLFADHITTFMVNTLLLTSDVVKEHKEKKAMVKSFINPELCEISEDLVFTEPFFDCVRNDVLPKTREFVEKEIWNDRVLKLETAKLKFDFMTNAQSLIHGDLHTGSVFIKKDSTKVIDPEFAFYGPAGYDVGNVLANLIFAYVNGIFTMEESAEKKEYVGFLETTLTEVVDLFSRKFKIAWDEHVTDETAKYPGFMDYYLTSILTDTAGVAGCELIRRTVGIAHVKDLTAIEDVSIRARAEKVCLAIGKSLILGRTDYREGSDYMKIVSEQLTRFSER